MTEQEFTRTYLTHLNPQQLAAVHAVEGASLLLAVPGSGKTTVLIDRLGYMVNVCGIDPASILTVTYTVAATEEMKSRFAEKYGNASASGMEFRTINGICVKIIEYYCTVYGKREPFKLIDDRMCSKMISDLYFQLTNERPTASEIKNIRSGITYIKNMRLSDDQIDAYKSDVPKLAELYRAYRSEMNSCRFMDYDDQMSFALTFLEKCPPVLAYFQDKFRYICVDESQDTSKIQHDIIGLLAAKHGNIFMVGDEDQSIYGFRAAYPEALMNFERNYPNAKILLMEQNFRSTEEIVASANAFVKNNRFRRKKVIEATKGKGSPVKTVHAVDREAQYKYLFAIARGCEQDSAILYRNNDSALPLIDQFERSGIPYNCKKPEEAFFTSRVVSDVTDIIRFAYAPNHAELFMRIYYRFDLRIPKKAAEMACAQGEISGRPLFAELLSVSELPSYLKDDLTELAEMFAKLPEDSAEAAVDRIWNRMGYGRFAVNYQLDTGKYAILKMLAKHEPSARAFLRRLGELREIIERHTNPREAKLTLSTIHSAKGLEYERVYLLDVLNGILPSISADDAETEDEIKRFEEERRLYYVAMTRAKQELCFFTCQNDRSVFTDEVMSSLPHEVVDEGDAMAFIKKGLCGKTYTHRSKGKGKIIAQCADRLLVEYAEGAELMTAAQMIEERDRTPVYETSTIKTKAVELLPPNSRSKYGELPEVGTRVKHTQFGQGTIKASNGEGIVSICFDNGRTKRFAIATAMERGILTVME